VRQVTAWDKNFSTQRISLLQPGIAAADLDQPVQHSMDRLVLDSYGNIMRLWADAHPSIPKGRLDGKFEVKAAARQPVSFLTADLQVIRRRVERRVEPARKSESDARPLPKGNPLAIVPLEDVSFPATTTSATHRLPGGEEINDCARCEASGHLACAPCGQTGRVACTACAGSKRIRCDGCGGNGLRQINGILVRCTNCLAAGYLNCTACGADGNQTCGACAGEGHRTCGDCSGYGRVCRYHVLVSEVSTQKQSAFHSHEQWSADLPGIAAEMEPLWDEELPFSFSKAQGGVGVFASDEYSPPLSPGMTALVRSLLRDAVATGKADQNNAETVRAVRLRVSACYLHRLNYTLDGNSDVGTVFIGGLPNRVAPGDLESRCRTTTAWVQRPFHSLLRSIGLVESAGPSKEFVERLGKGLEHVHLLDTEVHVAEAVENNSLTLKVSEAGYVLTKADGSEAGSIDLTHDSKQQRLLVLYTFVIGPAYRDKFIRALKLNSKLAFGRVGLHQDQSSGALEFRLYDVRVYAEIDAEQYAIVLGYLVSQANVAAAKALKD
jgi:hypothetical protein